MPVVMIDGQPVNVSLDQILADDGQNPFQAPVPDGYFSTEQVEAIRQQEKDKLYSQISRNNDELTELRGQVGTLTAAQQAEQDRLEAEQARLAAEKRQQEEADLDARSLLARRESEWAEQIANIEQTFNSRFEQAEQARAAAEAVAVKEREFNEVREYAQAQIAAHQEDIAPQLLGWVTGNTKEEIDANIARAQQTTNEILAEFQTLQGQQSQQVVPPNPYTVQPPVNTGTRATGGPGSFDPTANLTQQVTPEQIANMPMSEYAKYRQQAGIGGQSRSQGMFG